MLSNILRRLFLPSGVCMGGGMIKVPLVAYWSWETNLMKTESEIMIAPHAFVELTT